MNKYCFALIAPLALVVACSKVTEDAVLETNQVSIVGIINNDVNTKTDYVINESDHKAYFTWKGTEEIGRLYYSSGIGQEVYQSTTEASPTPMSPVTSLTFRGNEVSGDTGFALYPKKGAANGAGLNYYSSPFYLHLSEQLTYTPTAPLTNVIPMLGKLDGSGEYVFNTITGVLAVSISHIPPSANRVTIESSAHYLSEIGFRSSKSNDSYDDQLDDIYTEGLFLSYNNDASSKKKIKYYTFDAGLDFGETYVFYFPIPAGSLNNGTTDELTVTVSNGSTPLYTKTTSSAITIKKGYITRLPEIILPSNTVAVSVEGDSDDVQIVLNSKSSLVSYVKAYAALTSDAATAGVSGSGTTISALDTPTSIDGFSTSGAYYVAYQGYDSSDNPLTGTSGTVNAYYLSSTDKAALCKPFTLAGTDLSYGTITFDVSNDPANSNIKIIEIDGIEPSSPNSSKITSAHRVFSSTGSWIVNGTYPYNSAYLQAGFEPTGIYSNGTMSFNVSDKAKPLFYYGENAANRAGIILYNKRYSSDNNAPGELEFTYSTGLLKLKANDALGTRLRIRADGYTKPWGKTNGGALDYGTALGSYALAPISMADCTITTGENMTGEGSLASLTNNAAADLWHSSYSNPRPYDSTYGVYLSVQLPTPVSTIQVCFLTRYNNNNGVPRELRYWISSDGSTWSDVSGTQESSVTTTYTWVELPAINPGSSFSYLRIGFIKGGSELTTLSSSAGFVSLSELKLFGE